MGKELLGEMYVMKLADFKIGERVILARVKRPEYRGRHGTVQKLVKSRQEVKVLMDGAKDKYDTYGACPENIDKE